ncbi:MAG: hypothetical protein RMN51_13410 [Verrucomicrobiota bacterium]|nr:hypothetical protein [Limisphaera sp.]MDW8383091.1 hypothetical protein [Verrucomicrobiota bacterium]
MQRSERTWNWVWMIFLSASLLQSPAQIYKVLPQYLDLQGRAALSPSLFDRDSYQAQLRRNPEQRGSMRFQILWRPPGGNGTETRLRIELQGLTRAGLPQEYTIDLTMPEARKRRQWTSVRLSPETFHELGDVVAWRVTLWSGETLVSEQRSFLWTEKASPKDVAPGRSKRSRLAPDASTPVGIRPPAS